MLVNAVATAAATPVYVAFADGGSHIKGVQWVPPLPLTR